MNIIIDAYLDNNLGDDLMIKLLAGHFPRHRFYLYTNSSVVKNSFSDFKNLIIKKSEEKQKDLDSADVYCTVGGSRFQLVSAKQKYWRLRRLSRLRKIRRNQTKIVTLGSNFGPYSGKLGVKLTEWEMRKNDLITVRDKEAEGFLRQFKKVNNYHLVDDIVYNLAEIYKTQQPERSGLGISAYRSIRSPEHNYPNYKCLAALADSYIKKTGKKVKLFAFDTEDENDLAAACHIYNLAEEKEKIEIIPYLGCEQSFLEQFEACERMVAIRFHSAVLADIFEIPFLPVVYSNKMKNFLNDRGYRGPSFEIRELNLDLNPAALADTLIKNESLFNTFTGDQHNAKVHFAELEKILEKSSRA